MVIDDTTYTYGQLLSLAGDVFHRIASLKDKVIGVVAENKIETYASILAVLFSGKAYVILHPDFPAERNKRIASQAGVRKILSRGEKNFELEVSSEADDSTKDIPSESITDTFLTLNARPDAPAYIIFTSGSTGEPKGVPISRKNLNAFYSAYRSLGWKLSENDRMLQMFELTFDVSVVSFLYPLTIGACVYTVPQGGMKYLNVLDLMERHRLTFAAVAPSVLRLARPYFSELHLPDLKYLIVTAEATDVNLLSAFRPCAPNAEVVNLYGPTEATIYCTSYTIPVNGAKNHNGMAAIGKPFQGMDAVIVDEYGNPLPANEIGELWICGPQVMSGYWNAPEKTAACFAHLGDEIYYRTGDLCQIDNDGDIIYCGRKDTQVKIQGFRVELGEIEFQAKSFYHSVSDAVALPLYDENGACELHLAVEREDSGDEGELEAFLKSALPVYMLPKRIHYLPRFPLNSNNKTDKKELLRIINQL